MAKKFNLESMIKGWFVGNFKPSVYTSQDVEVAVKRYEKVIKKVLITIVKQLKSQSL